jgi:soluble lytic murein transglycosylase
MAQALRGRAPSRLPLALQSREFRRLLYPFPYREAILAQGKIRGVDPNLVAAVIREESRFDVSALSGPGRGLTQLSLATARRLAAELNLDRLAPEHLFQPGVSIALGAARLGALMKDFRGVPLAAVAAYGASEPQALVWRSWCFTQEPDEFFTKINDAETRDYVRRVMEARLAYQGAY